MFTVLSCPEQFSSTCEMDHCMWASLMDNEDSDDPLPRETYAILLGWAEWGRTDNQPYRQGTLP